MYAAAGKFPSQDSRLLLLRELPNSHSLPSQNPSIIRPPLTELILGLPRDQVLGLECPPTPLEAPSCGLPKQPKKELRVK
jgi:hypothetical protein